ncbi:hypothetical protein HWV62_41954 [Athelia sp. TMB]|nr:hypothetical protein HWV62_41954 [Athelia sp. TMB]
MNTLLRSSLFRRVPQTLRRPLPLAPLANRPLPILLHRRGAANNVSGRPGSQSAAHAAQNVKEEVGNSAADWAKTIAGGHFADTDTIKTDGDPTFIGVTSAGASLVPRPYMVMGLAGGLPYIAASGTTVYLAHQAGLAAQGLIPNVDPGVAHTVLDQALSFQVTYGAVMLSFLGAMHWGMEFAGYGGHKGYRRLALGAAPLLIAWPSLGLGSMEALITQWAAFTGLWWADLKVTGLGWTPKWYSQYRFYLSILVGTCIIGSLAGTSYWGPVAGHGLLSHDLDLIRAERKKNQYERSGVVGGDTEAVEDEGGEHYVKIHKHEANEGKDSEEGENANEGDNAKDAGDAKDGEKKD